GKGGGGRGRRTGRGGRCSVTGSDVGGRERLQRQEVRGRGGGVREAGRGGAVQSGRALQPEQHVSGDEERPQAGRGRQQARRDRAPQRDRAQAAGRSLQADRQGGSGSQDGGAGAGVAGGREGLRL